MLVVAPQRGETLEDVLVHEQILSGNDFSQWVEHIETKAFDELGWRREQLRTPLHGIVDRLRYGDALFVPSARKVVRECSVDGACFPVLPGRFHYAPEAVGPVVRHLEVHRLRH